MDGAFGWYLDQAHPSFARRSYAAVAAATQAGARRGGAGAVLDAQVLAPVAAHVLDQRHEGLAFGVSEYSTRGGTSGKV